MSDAEVLVEIRRGDIVECLHRGHAVVCDASGNIRAAWGNPDQVILPRSSCKMLQALPLVESGAAENLPSSRLALACASHEGGEAHVSGVSAWLAEQGHTQDDLLCGAQVPWDRTERHRLRAANEKPCNLHNNCSGKHAGFVMLNDHLRGSPEYIEVDHPVQKAVRAGFEEMTGANITGWGVDGCSAPNFGTTVRGLALAMARMADPAGLGPTRGRAAERLVGAMSSHPHLVAGEGRACTELMEAAAGTVAVKFGAEALFTAILPAQKIGVAIKIEDGSTRGAECAIAAILARLGVFEADMPAVAKRLNPPILSRSGINAGEIRPHADFWAGGAPI
ncbi:asparaginase [Amaricoccus tamworthensis]|uniref:asparaginase n=1 Tax=Amaricoccus tamworthensis TaxID=57002 RepID=UPI003C7D2F65